MFRAASPQFYELSRSPSIWEAFSAISFSAATLTNPRNTGAPEELFKFWKIFLRKASTTTDAFDITSRNWNVGGRSPAAAARPDRRKLAAPFACYAFIFAIGTGKLLPGRKGGEVIITIRHNGRTSAAQSKARPNHPELFPVGRLAENAAAKSLI